MRAGIHQQIVTALYEDIILGVFAFGNKLVEDHLAQKFGVKRHTIREAFVHLEEMGLVERIPNRGVFVREPSPKEVRDIYAVRSVLECHAAAVTVLPAEVEITQAMRVLQERHGAAILAADYRAVLHLNTEFHRTQFSACDNATLVTAIEDFATRTHLITAMKFGVRPLMDRVIEHHLAIIEAMEGSDNAKLVEMVRRHFDVRQVDEYERRYRMRYGAQAGLALTPRRRISA